MSAQYGYLLGGLLTQAEVRRARARTLTMHPLQQEMVSMATQYRVLLKTGRWGRKGPTMQRVRAVDVPEKPVPFDGLLWNIDYESLEANILLQAKAEQEGEE